MGAAPSKQISHLKTLQQNPHTEFPSDFPSDWSELPTDILDLISTKLSNLYEIVHFCAVCRSWYTAISLSIPVPRPPWIFFDDDYIPQTLQFYSMDAFEYSADLPQVEGMQLVGTTYHFMILLDEDKNNMFVINPITKKINRLPKFMENFPRAHHIGVDPVRNENSVVIRVKLSHDKLVLLLCRPDDKEWKIVPVPYQLDYGCAYYNGMYYINKGSTKIIELSTGSTVHTIPPPLEMADDQRFGYLVESFGELLAIWKNKLWCSSVKEYRFEVFRLVNEQQEYGKWIKMNNLGNKILFLNSSTGFCFDASEFPELKENSIYFVSAKCLPSSVGPRDEFFSLCRYDIKTGKSEELKEVESILAYWFFPSLQEFKLS